MSEAQPTLPASPLHPNAEVPTEASPGAVATVAPAATAAAPAPNPTDPGVPGYVLGERIGGGGMGVVYRAHDLALDRQVAVKFLHTAGSLHPDLRARFSNEALALARVRHPNVVQILEVGVADDRPFIAMALVEGKTLADRLKAGPLDPTEAAAYTNVVSLIFNLAEAVTKE